jgi:hypothetical protein
VTTPQPNHDSQDPSGDLDSGFFCDLVGVTTAFGKDDDTPGPIEGSGDAERIDDADIEESRTQVPPHKKGGIKTLMMFGLVSIPMTLLGFFLFGGSGTQEASTAAVQKPTETVAPAPKADFATDRRFSDMQSKLAIQNQQQSLLAAAKEQERERLEQEQNAKQAEVPQSKPATTATTPAPQPAEVSPPTNVEPPPQPVAVEPAIVPKPVARKAVVAAAPAPVLKPQTTAPMVRVATPIPARVALKATGEPPRVVTQIAPRFAPKPVSWQQAATGGSMVWTAKSATTTNTPAIASNTTVSAPSSQTTADRSARVLIPGQIRGVSLVTPIQVIAGEEAQDVLINLEQGFIDSTGTIAIPANSKVLAKISVAANGLVRIMDCTVIVGTKEYKIPAGAFTLSLTDNSPVIAQLKQFGGSEIGRRDLQTFLLGAAQGIGEALTQPTSTSQVIGPNGSFSATQNNPNVVGGLLKGGATPIVQQWLTRNQAEVARIEGMVRLWHLPSGQKLSLYAVKKIDLSN